MRNVLLFILAAFLPLFAYADRIQNIKIIGNERISAVTIETYLENRVGEEFNQIKIDDSIKNLFATGFFSNINISKKVNTLIVTVEENPLINKIAFEGNKKIKDDELKKELFMEERSVFSSYKLQNDLNRIQSVYQRNGRYSVKVTPKIIKLDQNRINLVYEIDEGNVSKIRKINFIGNEEFSSSKLSRVIASKEERWYRFFSSADLYDYQKLIYDQELLREFYLNEGFADFEVTSATGEITTDKKSFVLTFVINEGPIYRFGETNITSKIENLDTKLLYNLVEFKKGQYFNESELTKAVESLTDYLGDHGYAFVDVDYSIDKNKEEKLANVNFVINESVRVYVNKINIKNNTRTLDKVIRREFRIAEGDPYNTSKIFRSKQRIKNLGFFNNVELKNIKTDSPDKVDIDVEVEEKSTGAINFAAGYNTASGPLGTISLSESNFLGKGQDVSIGFTRAKRNSEVNFSFTEPYFLDYPLSAGFDIFSTSQDKSSESAFNSKSQGAVIRFGYDLTEHLFHGLRYSLKQNTVTNVSKDASIFIREQEGKNSVSAIGHTLTYDKLDDRLEPTKGYLVRLSQDLAGVGGQTFYIENRLSTGFYYPVYKREVVLSLLGKAGHIKGWNGKGVRINDRFFIGAEEIRGFDVGGIGPRDKKTGDALGGKTYYTGSAELSLPMGIASEYGLKGLLFTDIGTLYDIDFKATNDPSKVHNDKSLRGTYGIGFNWTSAIGTVRIYYGIPYMKKSFDETKRFYVTFGTRF